MQTTNLLKWVLMFIILVTQMIEMYNKIIMQSQRAIFSLKGTNINLPTRYKIRKYKPGKTKSQKFQNQQQHIEQSQPLIIQSKIGIPNKIKSNPENQILEEQERQFEREKIKVNTISLAKNRKQLFQEEFAKHNYHHNNQNLQNIAILRKQREYYSSFKVKRCACGNCEECMKDFNYFLQLFSDNTNIPEITAKSWCIWKKKNNKYMYYYGKRIHKVRQIASLTKIITAITAADFLTKYKLDPANIYFQIRKSSTYIGGTTANLYDGQVCSLLELFYGMMLPSGNDAAIAISEAIGLLHFLKLKNRVVNPYETDWFKPYATKNYSYIFIGLMNQKLQKIGTLDTKVFNSHGNDAYQQLKNVSTCNEIAKISTQFMNYSFLKDISKTVRYGPFQNTNKLLEDGFDGIKTGITDTAGPCLAASYKDFIIIVLNSKSMNERWLEVKKLVKWIIKKG